MYDMPLVSVRCISYNHEKYIREALDGILAQRTNFPIEIIVHDDASTDGSQAIIRTYAEKYPDIIVPILQRENQYSRGVKISQVFVEPKIRGKYCAVCECDDYWTDPHKLQKQIDFLEMHPEYSICGHAFETVDSNGNHILYDQRRTIGDHEITIEDIILNKNLPQTATLVYRNQYKSEMPSFFSDCMVGDYPLILYMGTRGKCYYFCDEMSHYRRHGNGSWVTRTQNDYTLFKRHVDLLVLMLRKYDIYTDKKYTDTVKLRIANCEFLFFEMERNITKIINNRYYKSLKMSKKIAVLVKAMFPSIYYFFHARYCKHR